MCAQNGEKTDNKGGGLTQDELADGRRRSVKDVKAQIEQDKNNMRASKEYREYEQTLREDVGPGKGSDAPDAFFDALVTSLETVGARGTFEREVAELFLADQGVEYDIEEKADTSGSGQPASEPPPAPELVEAKSEKVWQKWLAGVKDWTPEQEKEFIQKQYPEGLAVRGADAKWNEKKGQPTTAKRSNLDGEACLFFFRKLIGLDEKYLEKTKYVAPGQYIPGALNLDTSWGVWGGAGRWKNEDGTEGDRAETYDHHAVDAPRRSSAFQLLYDLTFGFDNKDGKEGEVYKNRTDRVMASPEEKIAWENLAMFVTAIDSLTLPPGVSWEEVWDNFENNIFAICVTHQGLMASRVEKLFEFFKNHSWEDAFKPLDDGEIKDFFGTVEVKKNKETQEKRLVSFSELQAETKQNAEDFFNAGRGSTLFSPVYGRILVAFNKQLPGSNLTAYGNGYDAMLLWKPEQNSFLLNVKPEKPPIPHALHEKLGKDQSVWVRGGMLFQPEWRSQAQGLKKLSFSFIDLIKELGIEEKTLSASFKRKIDEAEKCWKK